MRVRHSLQELCIRYENGDRILLENLIRAFRVIQSLPVNHEDSFFKIAGYHGEPFVREEPKNPDWWGGYCQHQTVLFPTWHRAYVYRLENALRNALPEAKDLAIPFWDECISYGTDDAPIPWIVTAKQLLFPVDGKTDNPLCSYKLQQGLVDDHNLKDPHRYNKPVDYQTVRYPLSGLVGNAKDKKKTEDHNSQYQNHEGNTKILNNNIKQWMDGTVEIKPDGNPKTKIPDTYSVFSRFQICLQAENYTIFSNKASMGQWIEERHQKPYYGVSLEEPHNAIHLAVGGFYQEGEYNASPIPGANGDMGENETAAFDPIFFLHHAFIDYTFWQWQLRHKCTTAGSLTIEAGKKGTTSMGNPVFKKGTTLDTDSPLAPFKQPNNEFYTSKDVTDIEKQLDYTYGPGSLDLFRTQGHYTLPADSGAHILHIYNISRSDYSGSFVIRTSVDLPNGNTVEIGREAVLSRWNVAGCANCQGHLNEDSFIAIDKDTMDILKGGEQDLQNIKFKVEIQSREVGGGWLGKPQHEPLVEFL
ncbi:tyrosinase [Fusarium heterosporum]|uniref:tyrosinase n=1 Tax=Fusarium heterosporum TaxID=42747 RepID=A0A8H5SQH1_FUSHE|nr:tyrosinase [Fusarium heterosporum]